MQVVVVEKSKESRLEQGLKKKSRQGRGSRWRLDSVSSHRGALEQWFSKQGTL